MRFLIALIAPGGLLLVAAVVFLHQVALPGSLSALVRVYPYAVFGAGILLGWRFHQGRLLFGILVLALSERALLYFSAADAGAPGVSRIVFNAVAFLLPLNLAALSLMTKWGIVTVRGLWRLGLILVQLLAVSVICRPEQAGVAVLLEQSFVNTELVAWAHLSQPALLAFGGASILVTRRFIRHPNAIESGLIWALLAAFLALNTNRAGPASTVYLATAGLILVTSIIETSYTMAYRDELTGLPSRRALKEALVTLGRPYTVAMLDVDHFKKFNDRHGHDVGDQLLRMVASKIENVSGGGKAFRYGGEEFTVIFQGKTMQEAVPYLEALRETIAESSFTLRGPDRRRKSSKNPRSSNPGRKKLSVTVSIGVATAAVSTTDPDQVIKAADTALYRAKKAGRNRLRT